MLKQNNSENASAAADKIAHTPKIHPAGLGRGSHPNSKSNLRSPLRDFAVQVLSTDGFWMRVSKPMTHKAATEAANRLALNYPVERRWTVAVAAIAKAEGE